MRHQAILIALAAVLIASSGCSSLSTTTVATPFREKFTPTYRTRVVNADQRKTYEAAKAALKEIGFRFQKGGAAQGILTGLSRVSSSSDLRSSSQMEIDVKLSEKDGGTEVAVLFSEISDGQFAGRSNMGASAPVRDTALYEVYFRYVEQALENPKE